MYYKISWQDSHSIGTYIGLNAVYYTSSLYDYAKDHKAAFISCVLVTASVGVLLVSLATPVSPLLHSYAACYLISSALKLGSGWLRHQKLKCQNVHLRRSLGLLASLLTISGNLIFIFYAGALTKATALDFLSPVIYHSIQESIIKIISATCVKTLIYTLLNTQNAFVQEFFIQDVTKPLPSLNEYKIFFIQGLSLTTIKHLVDIIMPNDITQIIAESSLIFATSIFFNKEEIVSNTKDLLNKAKEIGVIPLVKSISQGLFSLGIASFFTKCGSILNNPAIIKNMPYISATIGSFLHCEIINDISDKVIKGMSHIFSHLSDIILEI